jgi:hypothetical protein
MVATHFDKSSRFQTWFLVIKYNFSSCHWTKIWSYLRSWHVKTTSTSLGPTSTHSRELGRSVWIKWETSINPIELYNETNTGSTNITAITKHSHGPEVLRELFTYTSPSLQQILQKHASVCSSVFVWQSNSIFHFCFYKIIAIPSNKKKLNKIALPI